MTWLDGVVLWLLFALPLALVIAAFIRHGGG